MIARLLETLFDTNSYSLPTRILIGLIVIGSILWLMPSISIPTCAEETVAIREIHFGELVQRKELNERQQYQLTLIKGFNTVVETPDLRSFYSQAYCKKMDSFGDENISLAESQAASLPLFAQVGDSLIKRSGELTIDLKRDNRSYLFQYKCP